MIFCMSSHPLGDSYLLDTCISIFYEKVDSRTDSHNHRCSDHKNSLGEITKESNLRLWSACSLCFKVRLSAKPFVIHVTSVERVQPGERGVLNKRLYGEAPPEVQPLTLLYTMIFHEKCNPFVYPLLTNGTPFTYFV